MRTLRKTMRKLRLRIIRYAVMGVLLGVPLTLAHSTVTAQDDCTTVRITTSFKARSLSEALDKLSEISGCSIKIDKEWESTQVTVSFHETPLWDALDRLVRAAEIRNFATIATPSERRLHIRVLDEHQGDTNTPKRKPQHNIPSKLFPPMP
ncbi:hypothetical protein [Desulfovibrio inopinatus]|uniref:hypothetical protein n=1 Tax=Desulfovibrio inopinatus TaxID=102109 RepID=UPI0004156AFB|nr:hypothetical protein [Desulfovibrio inopinatus]